MISVRELLDRLSAEGRLTPDSAGRAATILTASSDPGVPWYIHGLVAAGSAIAAVLLIVFLSLAGALNEATSMLITGLVLCVLATGLRYAVARYNWLFQVPLALSLAGSILVFAGLISGGQGFGRDTFNTALLGLATLELAMIGVYPDILRRFIATWLVTTGLLGLLVNNDLNLGAAIYTAGLGWAAALLWERENATARRAALARPIAYGLVAGLFTCLLVITGDTTPLDWPASIGLALALAYVAWSLLARASLQARLIALAAVALLLAPAWAAPGILGAALVLVVGFSRGNRVLVGLGGLFLAGFIGYYYYVLATTLLLKSLYLSGAGLLLLAARHFIQRYASHAGLS